MFDLQTQSLTGAAGYAALESLGDDTLVAVTGPLDPATRTLAADRVVLIPDNLDAVEGLVVARSGGPGDDATLTLRGVSVRRSAGAVTFNDTVTLSASFAQTVVRRRGSATALDTDAINVGQRIVAYGVLSGATLDLTQAGAGFVRLVQTGFGGAVTAAASGSLTLDLARIGARRTTAFDFSVDGVAQADPDALVVDTGALSLSGITTGSAVRVLGFVAPVTTDATATPDVVANTVIDRTGAASLLHVGYFPASTSAVATTTTASLQLDVSTASVAVVDQGLVSPMTLSADPTVTGGQGAFAVRRGFQITLYGNFSSFDQRLRAELAGGARLRRLTAIGGYTAGTTTLDARRVVAVLR